MQIQSRRLKHDQGYGSRDASNVTLSLLNYSRVSPSFIHCMASHFIKDKSFTPAPFICPGVLPFCAEVSLTTTKFSADCSLPSRRRNEQRGLISGDSSSTAGPSGLVSPLGDSVTRASRSARAFVTPTQDVTAQDPDYAKGSVESNQRPIGFRPVLQ